LWLSEEPTLTKQINEMKNTTPKKFYAVSFSHGLAVGNDGKRYGAGYHQFDTAVERDEWTEGGGDFRSSQGWRDAIKSRDSELRAFRKNEMNELDAH
jgi:hypothetical protein